MIPVGIINYSLYPNAEHIPEAQRTVAQQIALDQRNASFVTLTIVEMSIFWIIGFLISNEYFRQYPLSKSLLDHHKATGIPLNYYKVEGLKEDNEAKAKEASDSSNTNPSKGEGQSE